MKILLVHNSYQQRGGEDTVFEQERRLLESAGHRVTAYQRSNSELGEVPAWRRLALAPSAIWSSGSREEMLRLLCAERPDVVHVHNTFMMISPSIYSACHVFGIPVVQTLHNYRLFCPAATFFRDGKVCEQCVNGGLGNAIRYGCYRDSRPASAAVALMLAVHRRLNTWNKHVDRFIALSEFSRQKFIEAGLPAEKIVVKPNFLDPDPGERSVQGDYAVYVGRLSAEKGVHTLLRAWKKMRSVIPLVIVGDGPQRVQLENECSALGLQQVRFAGQLPREQVLATIKDSRFLVFPSEWYECFPMTIIEAFACGVPVIASSLGGREELVAESNAGLVFEAGNPEDCAAKVEFAWSAPELTAHMGAAARRIWQRHYTGGSNYLQLMNIYASVIADPALAAVA